MERFEQLYREQFGFVWALARHFGVPSMSLEDVTQEVFLTAYRRLPRLRFGDSPRGWLYGVTRRVASRHRRGVARRMRRHREAALHHSSTTEPHRHRDAAQTLEVLVQQLDPRLAQVYTMTEVLGLSGPEISAELGIPMNTVYSRVHAARKRLAELAGDEARCAQLLGATRLAQQPPEEQRARCWATIVPLLGARPAIVGLAGGLALQIAVPVVLLSAVIGGGIALQRAAASSDAAKPAPARWPESAHSPDGALSPYAAPSSESTPSSDAARSPNAAYSPDPAHSPDAAHSPDPAYSPDAAHSPDPEHSPDSAPSPAPVLSPDSAPSSDSEPSPDPEHLSGKKPSPGSGPSLDSEPSSDPPPPDPEPSLASLPSTSSSRSSDPPPPLRARPSPIATSPSTSDTLAAELALLDASRTRLADGAPRQALELLDRHQRQFPRGQLADAREATRVSVLCRLGHRARAERLAAQLRTSFPSSTVAEQVPKKCASPHKDRPHSGDGTSTTP